MGLNGEAAEEASSGRNPNHAASGHQAQEANGSFGQADDGNNEPLSQGTGRRKAQAANAPLHSQLRDGKGSKASHESKLLTPSERSEVAYLKNIPEIEDNLSNKVINLNHSSQ